MKKIFLLILCINILLSSCSNNDDGEDPEVLIANTAPTKPVMSYPTNNLVCIENVIDFQWAASTDAEDHVPIYEVQMVNDLYRQYLQYKN